MVLGLSVFAFAAIALAAYMVAARALDPALVAGALFLLAAGQIGVVIAAAARTARLESVALHQQQSLRGLSDRTEQAAEAAARAENAAENPAVSFKLDELSADIRALRDGFRTLLQPKEPEPQHAHDTARNPQARPAASAAAPSADQRLELLLEPVVELASGSTAHYRALLDLSDDHGHVVQHAELMDKADAGGMRAALDAHMVKHVAPVLRRLRLKNPAMRAVVPIGASTLSSREDMARLAALIEREIDVANGMVFELHHRDLGRLDTAGIEGLARLGRLGATLALSGVQVAGLDLAALRQLGVRFLSFPPSAADAGFGPTPAWREFVQYARAMQFQIIISGVDTAQQASAATQIARYAHGAFFAPPRRVRARSAIAPRRSIPPSTSCGMVMFF